MLIIPAIDLKDGCVVRYVQGRLNKKVYSRDPVKTAKHWVKLGAKLIHVVDLDGAFSGKPKNLSLVKDIARSIDIPIEFGGGVRSIETIKEVIDSGISRVVLGTKAVEDKKFLEKAFRLLKEKVIVGLDAKDSNILIKGWKSSSKGSNIFDFAINLKKIGFKELIYTDTLKDGTLKGPNIKGIKSLLSKTGMKIIASGGISALDDIRKLKAIENKGVVGVIIGKALYEGRFTLPEAIKLS